MTFYFDSFEHFLLMDGHGFYVWACVCMTVIALTPLLILPLKQRKSLAKMLAQQTKQQSVLTSEKQ